MARKRDCERGSTTMGNIITCDNDHTCNNGREVDGRALHAHIATAKYGAEEASVGSIASLGHLVAAVELGIAASLDTLLDHVVSLDCSLVGSAVTGILALVAYILVSFSIIARRGDLAADEGRCRDGERKSQEREDVLSKHGE